MFDSFVRYKADKNRLTFIRNCETFDTPRLENEVYPAECKTEMDIEYKHGNNPLKLASRSLIRTLACIWP